MIRDLSKKELYSLLKVHQEIGHETYVSMTNEPFIYPSNQILVRRRIQEDPTNEERRIALFHFQQEGAINIIQMYDYDRYSPEKWLIEVINPKFSELAQVITDAMNTNKSFADWIMVSPESNGSQNIKVPQERDYWYEDNQLKFRLANGGVDQFDFSKAEKSQKVFETFWDLWNGNSAGEYTLIDVRSKYKEKFKTEAPDIGIIVSNVRASIINPKTMVKDRIDWRYNRKNKKWIFKILPLQR